MSNETTPSNSMTTIPWKAAIESGERQELLAARQQLEARLREDGSDFAALEGEVRVLVALRDSALAQQLLDEYLRYYPDDNDAMMLHVWMLQQQGKIDDGEAELKALIARSPGYEKGWEELLRLLMAQDDIKACLKYGEEAVAKFPHNAEISYIMGQCYLAQRNEAGAAQAFTLALGASERRHVGAKIGLARISLARNQKENALELAAELEAEQQLSADIRCQLLEILFQANAPVRAMKLLEDLSTNPVYNDDGIERHVMEIAYRSLGKKEADAYFLKLLGELRANDSIGVELLELSAEHRTQKSLDQIYKIATTNPLRYPRTMGRILSTFHTIPLLPSAITSWITANSEAINSNNHLWGAVGAYYVAKRKFREARRHFETWPHRSGVKPWMLLLLARACEEESDFQSANATYRAALDMPSDHSEAEIRSRLAYNLALSGLPGNGQLILADCSPFAKQYAGVAFAARKLAVEALLHATQIDEWLTVREFFSETHNQLRAIVTTSTDPDAQIIPKQFRERTQEILSFLSKRS